jgi:hypothetical protein
VKGTRNRRTHFESFLFLLNLVLKSFKTGQTPFLPCKILEDVLKLPIFCWNLCIHTSQKNYLVANSCDGNMESKNSFRKLPFVVELSFKKFLNVANPFLTLWNIRRCIDATSFLLKSVHTSNSKGIASASIRYTYILQVHTSGVRSSCGGTPPFLWSPVHASWNWSPEWGKGDEKQTGNLNYPRSNTTLIYGNLPPNSPAVPVSSLLIIRSICFHETSFTQLLKIVFILYNVYYV